MNANKQDGWNRSNANDTFFNAAVVGVAFFVVVAQAVVSGDVESRAPRHEAAATAQARA